MARRKLVWHIGLPNPPRAVVGENLAVHRESIEAAGVRVVATHDQARRATHELLRTHRDDGLARAEVEGTWARICDRVWEHKGTSVLSTPGLGAADKEQVRYALDPLIGVEVHLLVTVDSFSRQLYGGWLAELRAGRSTGWEKYVARVLDRTSEGTAQHPQAERFWAGHELASVLARWSWTLHHDRVHVVAQEDVDGHWCGLLDLLGLPADELPCVVPPYADPAGVAVLRRVNRQLEGPVAAADLDRLVGTDADGAAMPTASTVSLQPLVDRWQAILGQSGYDVRGDLDLLVDDASGQALPGHRDQLAVAVDALADALSENARLREVVARLEAAERDRPERRRRRWKDLSA